MTTSLKCLFGLHQWDGCRCGRCGKTRDKGPGFVGLLAAPLHDWTKNCEKCARCGKERGKDHHDWSKNCQRCWRCGAERTGAHRWKGCKCWRCGQNKDHDWAADCEKCACCGVERTDTHQWKGCKCERCSKINPDVLALKNRDVEVYSAAAGSLAARRAIEPLLDALAKSMWLPHESERAEVMTQELRRHFGASELIQVLESPNEEAADAAALVLGEIGDPSRFTTLT
jgi:hypothetical protein